VYKVAQDCIILSSVPACLPFCMPACLALAHVQAVAGCKVDSLYVRGLALDPENKFWATASADGTLQVWELHAGSANAEEKKRKKIAPQVISVVSGMQRWQ
jgi:WD40 repeat protein